MTISMTIICVVNVLPKQIVGPAKVPELWQRMHSVRVTPKLGWERRFLPFASTNGLISATPWYAETLWKKRRALRVVRSVVSASCCFCVKKFFLSVLTAPLPRDPAQIRAQCHLRALTALGYRYQSPRRRHLCPVRTNQLPHRTRDRSSGHEYARATSSICHQFPCYCKRNSWRCRRAHERRHSTDDFTFCVAPQRRFLSSPPPFFRLHFLVLPPLLYSVW